jgi:type II secretory pathway pseudopilin PulG
MRAFTLIEAMVSMFILGVIIAGILAVATVGQMTVNMNMGLLDIQQPVRQSIDGMIRELRQGDPNSLAVAPGGGRIDFSIPGISNGISYYIQNSQIIREHPVGTTKILVNNATLFRACCNHGATCDENCVNTKVVEITLQGTKLVRNTPVTFNLREKVRLRH